MFSLYIQLEKGRSSWFGWFSGITVTAMRFGYSVLPTDTEYTLKMQDKGSGEWI